MQHRADEAEPRRLGIVLPAGPAGYFAGSFAGAVVVVGEAGAAAGGDEPGDPGAGANVPLGTGIWLPFVYMHCRYVMS